jgi:hypothetical protein
MDVVAMGGWIGWYINLSHIQTMRSMNSRLKLYWDDIRYNLFGRILEIILPKQEVF